MLLRSSRAFSGAWERGWESVVLTWNLKFALSLEELGVCYNEFLSLLRGKLLAGDLHSIQNSLGRIVWVQSRSYHEVRSRGRVAGRGRCNSHRHLAR